MVRHHDDRTGVTRAHGFNPEPFVQACEEIGLNRVDLARLARLEDTTIMRWESRETVPSVLRLRAVLNELNKIRREAGYAPLEAKALIDVAPDKYELSDYRHILLLTPDEAAAAVGISATTLRRIEQGRRALTPDLTTRLAAALGIPDAEVKAAWERASTKAPELSGAAD
jgi:transcriptional regulator with XRE-family HTH domain